MPYLPIVGTLVKSDRRSQWTALKSKHGKAIAAKKLNFDAKLGPALDKYQEPVKAVDKLFAAEKVSQPAIQKVLAASQPLRNIAEDYLDRVKGLGDPAEKELTAFLKGVIADCTGWVQVSNMLEQDSGPRISAGQLAAVRELQGLLHNLDLELQNLSMSVPAAQAELKAPPARPDPNKKPVPDKKPTNATAAEWNAVNNLTQTEWAQILRAKIDPIVTSAASLHTKRSTVQKDLAPLLIASVNFNERSDYASFKDRAQTIAAASLPIFQQQARSFALLQADPEFESKLGLGFGKGLPGTNLRRAGLSAAGAADAAEKLLADIHRLP